RGPQDAIPSGIPHAPPGGEPRQGFEGAWRGSYSSLSVPLLGLKPSIDAGLVQIHAWAVEVAVVANVVDYSTETAQRLHGQANVLSARRGAARQARSSRSDYFSTVRRPAGPPGTLIWPVTFSDLPSKLSTSSALSSMDCASNVLPSLLQTTPCPQPPTFVSAARMSLPPSTR